MTPVTSLQRGERPGTPRGSDDRLFRAIVESVAVGIAVADIDARLVRTNRELQEMLGYTAAELEGMSIGAITHRDDIDANLALLGELIAGRRDRYQMEKRYVRKDGSVVWGNVNTALVRDDQGRPEFVVATIEDIDARKRVEEGLQEAEARYRTLVEQLPLVTYIDAIDALSSNIYTSPQIESLLGYTVEEWTGDPELFVKVLHPDDRDRVMREVAEANASGDRFASEYRLVARDGRIVWFRDESLAVHDQHGLPLYDQGYLLDITERKATEEALRESEERFRSMADDAPVLIWTTDEQGRVTYFSKGWLDFTGRTSEQELGFGWVDSVHPDDVETALDSYLDAIREREPWQALYRLRRHDGAYRWIEDRARPRVSSDGTLAGYIGIGTDISDRKEAEQALVRRESVLEAVASLAEQLLRTSSLDEVDLSGIGEAAAASRAYVFEKLSTPHDSAVVSQRCEWVAEGIVSLIDDPALEAFDLAANGFQDWVSSLSAGRIVHAHVRDVAGPARDELTRQGVRSILIVPIAVDGGWGGFVGFDECERERVWTDGEIEALRAAAGIFGEAIRRQRVARSLGEATETLEAVVTASPAAIIGFDPGGRVILWSKAAERIFGWTAEEAVGRFNPFVPGERREEFLGYLQRGLAGESWSSTELRRRRKDGTEIIISAASAPLRNADGDIVGMTSIASDVTDQKRVEDALRESEARFTAFMNNSQALAFMKDDSGRYVYVNESWEAVAGRPVDEIIGLTDFDLYPREVAEAYRAADDVVRESSEPLQQLEPLTTAAGDERTVLTLKFPFEDPAGSGYVGGVAFDVTERERVQRALRETTQMLEALVQGSPVAIVTSDLDGCVTGWNPAAEAMLGWTADEVLGKPVPHMGDDEDASIRSRIVEGEALSDAEGTRLRKDGAIIDVRYSKAPLRDAHGAVIGAMAMLTDVTERRRAEAALEEATNALRAIIDSSPLAIVTFDRNGLVTSWNDAAERTFGWPAAQVVGHPNPILRPEDEAPFRKAMERALEGRSWRNAETVRLRADGSAIHVSISSGPLRGADGETVGMVAMLADISEQKRSEAALRESEERFRTLVANVPGVIYRCAPDDDWTMSFMSDAIETLAGYGADEFIGNATRTYAGIIHDDDRHDVARAVSDALAVGEPFSIEYRITHADGSVRWVSEEGRPVYDPDGSLLWLDGVIFDVTDQKRTQDERVRTQALLDSVVEHIPTPLFVKDAEELRFVRVNRAAEEMWGYSRDELIGKGDRDFFPPDQAEFFIAKDTEVLDGKQLVDIPDEPIETRDGGKHSLHTRKVPILGEDGTPIYLLGISEDITERKRAEAERERLLRAEQEAREALEAQNERLVELDLMKDEFVALVSHELRTPLTSILGYLELILDGEAGAVTDDQRNFLSIVERNSQRLLRLVGDLLFVAQIEAGKLVIDRETVDLVGLARDCIEAARPRAAEKAIELSLDARDPAALEGDRTRLAQLLDNLVSNAIKFTGAGGRVAVRLVSQNGHRVVQVSDTGMGLSADELERLFERFYRTEGATHWAIQGTGLGLTITKAIAEAHGGTIAVESEPGKGTTFIVDLPAAEGRNPPNDA